MKLRKSTKLGLALLVLFALYGIWYLGTNSMGVVAAYEVNSPTADKHLLIVTQQSTYKDSVTRGIVSALRDQAVHIRVMDLTSAATFRPAREIDACILMHTWEMFRPPGMVHTFRKSLDPEVPLLVIATSGGGDKMLDGVVDGISSASEIHNAERDIQRAVSWARFALGFVPMDLREDFEMPPSKTQAKNINTDVD